MFYSSKITLVFLSVIMYFLFLCIDIRNIKVCEVSLVLFMLLILPYPQVSDIQAAIKDLKSNNIRTLGAEPKIGAHGKPVIFLHPKDCNGTLVELEQE